MTHYSEQLSEKRLSLIQRVVRNRQLDLTLIIENIHDQHNVGAIFRTADAVGIDAVHLLYTKEKFPALHPKVTASGAKWVKQEQHSHAQTLVDELHGKGFKLYSTHLSSDAVSIHDVDWTQPSAIILGNENRGVSSELTDLADQNIIIPMFGMVESLNVSVATAVILFEACRQRIQSGSYPNSTLDPAWLETMTENWATINRRKR
jgi:tRNA (guanosine-2'-O-)-methyltransferase